MEWNSSILMCCFLCHSTKLPFASILCTITFGSGTRWTKLPRVTAETSILISWTISAAFTRLYRTLPVPILICGIFLSLCLPSEPVQGYSIYSDGAACVLPRGIMNDLLAVKFQEVDTSSSSCRLSVVVLPAQSYLANCPDVIAV